MPAGVRSGWKLRGDGMAGKNGWKRVAPNVYRRGSSYQVRLTNPVTGKKETLGPKDGAEDRASAIRVRDERRAEFARGKRTQRTQRTIGDFADDWPTGDRAASTVRHYREQITLFLKTDAHTLDGVEFIEGSHRVADLRFDQFTRRMAKRFAERNPGRARAVSAFFSDAVDEGFIEQNPFHRLGLGRGKGRGGRKLVALNREEVDLLAEAAREENGDFGDVFEAMVLTLAWTGVRPGELFVLRWTDIDWETNRITVRRSYRTKSKELVPYTKNTEQRTIVMPEPLRAPLRRLQAAHDPSERPAGDEDNVFATREGKQFMLQGFQYYWRPVRASFEEKVRERDKGLEPSKRRYRLLFEDADGKKRNLDPYELRHFCATYLLSRGLPAHRVARQLGHKDNGALVLATYAHPDEDEDLAAIDAAFGA